PGRHRPSLSARDAATAFCRAHPGLELSHPREARPRRIPLLAPSLENLRRQFRVPSKCIATSSSGSASRHGSDPALCKTGVSYLMTRAPSSNLEMTSLVAEIPGYLQARNPTSRDCCYADLQALRAESTAWELEVSRVVERDHPRCGCADDYCPRPHP